MRQECSKKADSHEQHFVQQADHLRHTVNLHVDNTLEYQRVKDDEKSIRRMAYLRKQPREVQRREQLRL